MVWNDGGRGGSGDSAPPATKLLWLGWASFLLCLVALLIECVCGCRRNRIPKNELLGLAGLVKITNPDENVNYNRGATDSQNNGHLVPADSADDQQPTIIIAMTPSSDSVSPPPLELANKRSAVGGGGAVATATRSLPDLPVDPTAGTTPVAGKGGAGVPIVPTPDQAQPLRNKLWPPSCLQGTTTSADNNSELYATVEESSSVKKAPTAGGVVSLHYHGNTKVPSSTASILVRGTNPKSDSKHISCRNSGDDYYRYLGSGRDEDDEEEEEVYATTTTSGSDSLSPYARLNGEHPYDQLQIVWSEHQYAQVGQHGGAPRLRGGGSGIGISGPLPAVTSSVATQASAANNIIYTLSRRRRRFNSSGDNVPPPSLGSEEDYSSVRRSSVTNPTTIAAASAITGGVPANSDLPYMTPPLAALIQQQQQQPVSSAAEVTDHSPPTQQQPQHFSGDSQDSSKGYTSISVREPLSQIRCAMRQLSCSTEDVSTRQSGPAPGHGDPHYATVSDDSDDMYAAIEEKNVMTASLAGTTPAITPLLRDEMEGAALGINSAGYASVSSQVGGDTSSDTYAQIAPPQQGYHARQESSSSGCSLTAVSPGSPKREKRQANSPLPEPPPLVSQPPVLDDMYAKVVKKKNPATRSSSESPEAMVPPPQGGYDGSSQSSPRCGQVGGSNDNDLEPNYEELSGRGVEVTEPDYASLLRPHYRDGGSSSERVMEPPYERVCDPEPISLPHYETVTSPRQHYETMGGDDSVLQLHYEMDDNPSHYETLNTKKKDGSTQDNSEESQLPHYETVAGGEGCGDVQQECQPQQLPHYETVKNSTPEEEQPHYETVSGASECPESSFEHYETV